MPVRNHTAKPFEVRSTDHICVGFQGNNRVFVKDNHGTITKVNRKDVTPVEMDIKIAELFNESRQNSKIRDAQLAMPTSKIPDLGWQVDEDIQLVEPNTEQINSLEPTQEKAQNPMAPPIEKKTTPVQPVKEAATETVPTEAVEIQAVQTPKIEECQINLQTLMVFKLHAVLKPVAAAVTQQITNKTHFQLQIAVPKAVTSKQLENTSQTYQWKLTKFLLISDFPAHMQ